jgi:hypothetical protein
LESTRNEAEVDEHSKVDIIFVIGSDEVVGLSITLNSNQPK